MNKQLEEVRENEKNDLNVCLFLFLFLQAPIVPNYRHPGDTSNFEKYPDMFETDKNAPAGDDPYKHLFVEFTM